MTPKELRNSIFLWAFTGKSTQKFVKNSIDLSIDKAKKNSYLEKNKDKKNMFLNSEREESFDIPETWRWIKLGYLISYISTGKNFKYESEPNDFYCLGQKNNQEYGIEPDGMKYISKNEWDSLDNDSFLQKNDVLLNTLGTGTMGRSGIWKEEFKKATHDSCLMVIRTLPELDPEYLFFFLRFQRKNLESLATGSTNQKSINKKDLLNFYIPVTAIDEQKAVVQNIKKLLNLSEQYEASWNKLEKLNDAFPAKLERSLLKFAIEGKLVPQISNEGTGEEALRKLKESNLDKNYSVSKDEEQEEPFSIPESWIWCKLENVVAKKIKRGKSPKYVEHSNTLVFAQKCNTKRGVIDLSLSKCLDESIIKKYPDEEFMRDGDIVLNSTGGGTLGRVGKYSSLDNQRGLPVVPDSHVTIIRPAKLMDPQFVYFVLKYYQPYLESLGEGSTNQTELAPKVVANLLFPLPPFYEQKRIVAKIEELLPLCRKLIKQN